MTVTETLDDLEEKAKKAKIHELTTRSIYSPETKAYIAACSPDRILTLVKWAKKLATTTEILVEAIDTIWGLEAVPDEAYDASIGEGLKRARESKLAAFQQARELLEGHLDAEQEKK